MEEVADSQALILGPKTEAFEKAVAAYCGAGHAIGVSSGTDAQLVLLMALGNRAGRCGHHHALHLLFHRQLHRPPGCAAGLRGHRSCDFQHLAGRAGASADEHSPGSRRSSPCIFSGSARTWRRSWKSPRATACRCSKTPRRRSARSIRSARRARWARRAGSPFTRRKTSALSAMPGMVVCRDAELAAKIRALRNHGMETRYFHQWIGGNFRIDALQSAVLQREAPAPRRVERWAAGRVRLFTGRNLPGWAWTATVRLPVEVFASSGLDESPHLQSVRHPRAPAR